MPKTCQEAGCTCQYTAFVHEGAGNKVMAAGLAHVFGWTPDERDQLTAAFNAANKKVLDDFCASVPDRSKPVQ